MGKRLLIVGGGHAHMTLLRRLGEITAKGHRVTVVSPSCHHYYSGMGPGMLSGIYTPRQLRFNIKRMAEGRGASFIEESAVRIDPEKRSVTLASGVELPYDVATFNTGSGIPLEPLSAPSAGIVPVKPIINLLSARREILERLEREDLRISVVGGGAAGVEIAANVWRLARDRRHGAGITLVGGERILGRFPPKVRDLAIKSLERRGIRVAEGKRAQSVAKDEILLADGERLKHDIVFMAVGVRPSPLFADSGLPVGDDSGLLVDRYLRSVRHPHIFGGGDCVSLEETPLAKVGVYAVRQNPVILHNVMAALEGGEPRPFDPGGTYLLIMNMGDGTGVLWKGGLVTDGRLAFILKDFIDHRFMARFQVSGELQEEDGDVASWN